MLYTSPSKSSSSHRIPLIPGGRLRHSGLMHCTNFFISLDHLADAADSVGGTSMPSCFAVLRFITSWYLVGCTTGSSEGFSPIRPT
jgi:hypothetical protein